MNDADKKLNKHLALIEEVLMIGKSDEDNVVIFPTPQEAEEYREAKKETEGVRILREFVKKHDTAELKKARRRLEHNRRVQHNLKNVNEQK